MSIIDSQSICIIVPAYNEGTRLPISEFEMFLSAHEINFCFVNDGSTDNTELILTDLKNKFPDKIHILTNKQNKGKAESVRLGVSEALKWKSFDFVGYFDADLATPLPEIYRLMDNIYSNKQYRFALGCRLNRLGANIKRNTLRHYIGRVFATIASIVLKMPVYDTQCGAKLIESTLAKEIFSEPFLSKWLFDIELLARVRNLYTKDIIVEVPLNTWIEIGKTKIKMKDVLKLPIEFYKISKKYN